VPRIAEGLHRLGSDLINFYLVEDATGVIVVDAGVPAFYDKLEACLDERKRTWDDVRAIVLTHGHFDHVGFAERVRVEHGVPVLVHAADETLAHTQAIGKRESSLLPTCATRPPGACSACSAVRGCRSACASTR
jgi:glyoxylase-like metal-dependent hydrolase (beta-lactamase superfamily II)